MWLAGALSFAPRRKIRQAPRQAGPPLVDKFEKALDTSVVRAKGLGLWRACLTQGAELVSDAGVGFVPDSAD